jgi:AhpD family alkylhydroperoxidase
MSSKRTALSGPLGTLARAAEPEFEGFMAFHDKAERADGAIPAKYRELMAVAVGLTTQCQSCIERHTRRAKDAGATEQELAETVFVAAAVRAGGAVVHGMLAVKAFGGAGG